MTYKFLNTSKGRFVIYAESINGDAFISLHPCNGMKDEDAKREFHREHKREVLELLMQKNKKTTYAES
jgi:hypothetical protein